LGVVGVVVGVVVVVVGDEVVGWGVGWDVGVVSTVFDELGIVGSESCLQSDTCWTQGVVSGWELNVGRLNGGIVVFIPAGLRRRPVPNPTRIANGPAMSAHLLIALLSVDDRNGFVGAK
jgi:hypothetical protein